MAEATEKLIRETEELLKARELDLLMDRLRHPRVERTQEKIDELAKLAEGVG